MKPYCNFIVDDWTEIGLDVSKLYSKFAQSGEFEDMKVRGDAGGEGWISGDIGYDFEERETQDQEWYMGNKGEERRGSNVNQEDGSMDKEDVFDGYEDEIRIPATLSYEPLLRLK